MTSRRGHFVGFDGLRLLAAVAVLFSHSFLIATGSETGEPLVRLLGPHNIAGTYGVFTFFIISGFLLARSLSRNPDALSYAVNRACRIMPAFCASTLVLAFVVGPTFTSLPARSFLSSGGVRDFLVNSLDTMGEWPLPGLFAYAGHGAERSVNGSLWSLHYEVLSYLFLLVLWVAVRDRAAAFALVGTAVLVWLSAGARTILASMAYTLPYFAGGVLMFWLHARYGTTRRGAMISAGALIVAAVFGAQMYAFAVFGAYLVIFVGERQNPASAFARVVGDCSYGLYLYGWPIEQAMKQVTGTTHPMSLFAPSLLVAFGLAFASCHLVERPAMRWRSAIASIIGRTLAAVFGRQLRWAMVGARVGFLITATSILLSARQAWFVLESIGLVILCALVAAAVAAATAEACSRIVEPRVQWRGRAPTRA